MKLLVIVLLMVSQALAGTDQGSRDAYTKEAEEFFEGAETISATLEMAPSPDCLEGDMMMTDEQKEAYFMMREVTAKNRARVRRAASAAFRTWPDRTVLYRFDPSLSNRIKGKFREATEVYEEYTCIQFKQVDYDYEGDVRPLTVKGTGKGCYSTVGGPGGNLNLQENKCDHHGVTLHEIGHALGLYHEQTRPDRDDYVKIKENNIRSGYAANFKLVDRHTVAPYDYNSIMHYGPTAFSKNGWAMTIEPLDPTVEETMGVQQQLTRLDIYTLNVMYECYAPCPDLNTMNDQCQHGGVPSKNCGCICPDEYTGPFCEIFNAQDEWSELHTEESGIIMSPHYPARYPLNVKSVYAIECPAGKTVSLHFEDFDIEGYGCFYDVIEVKTGDLLKETYPRKFCDRELKGVTIQSIGNTALLTFKSDIMFTYKGFKVAYNCE